MMLSGDHCLAMPSGIRQESMERYLKSLLSHSVGRGANLPEWIENFGLVPIADNAAIELLYQQGVKRISLNIGQYLETSVNREEARRNRGIFQSIGLDVLMDLVTRDEDRRQIEEAENVNARLVIWINSNRRGIRPETFSGIARVITDDNPDGVEFETTTGAKFKYGDLIIKRQVDLPQVGQSVSYNMSWDEMTEFFNQLLQDGILAL